MPPEMSFYANANLILPITTVRRERLLPADTTTPELMAQQGQRVEADDVLIRGARAGRYRIIPLLKPLRVRRAADLKSEWIRVQPGDIMETGQVLAQRGTGRRAPRVTVPVDCIVTRVEADRVIVQENPKLVEVYATFPGTVTAVRGRAAVQIESYGALLQGAWGNGRRTFGFYVAEPEGGLKSLADETLLTTLRGQILWLNRAIVASDLSVAEQQEVKGIIAPGMPADLIDAALASPLTIFLTDGFGAQRMAEIGYNLLRDNLKRQAALDARLPARDALRPELFVPLQSGGAPPPMPIVDKPLAPGMMVRIARVPYAGAVGKIVRIADLPRPVDNGLRLPGADVALPGGQVVYIPVANLETLGRASE